MKTKIKLSILIVLIFCIIYSCEGADQEKKKKKKKKKKENQNDPYHLLTPSCPSRKEPSGPVITWRQFSISKGITDTTSHHIVIPCDTTVLVEKGTHLVFNGGLAIKGKLLFEDGGDPITIESIFILVLGWMKIGNSSQDYFKSKVTFVLKDHPDRATLIIKDGLPAQYDFGRKAFVVLGGKVVFHGTNMNAPVYVQLDQSAYTGEKRIVVNSDVSPYWKRGDKIAIASSSFHGAASTEATISDMKVMTRGQALVTELILDRNLIQDHKVKSVKRTDRPEEIFLRPEVIHLNRNIIIRGENENTNNPNAQNIMGGHFMISHTKLSQIVEGVEFINMGQAGISGKYPIHYHFGGHVSEKSRITRNSIHDSLQRCIVVHATHDLLVNENVSYKTHGHCYLTEDGIETGNKFIANVAMDVRKGLKQIPVKFGDAPTDFEASGFWFAGPTNHIMDNIVAGAHNSGFWYESFSYVGGESKIAQLPRTNSMNMKMEPFGEFRNNVAHSLNIGLNPGYGREPTNYMIFQDFMAWTVFRGFHVGAAVKLGLQGVTIVDFLSCGISALNSDGLIVENALLVGEIEVPKYCESRDVAGLKISPAQIPPDRPAGAFLLKDLHFQNLSTETNCQASNVAIEVAVSKDQKWGMNSYTDGVSFDDETVDTRWVVHNFNEVDNMGIMAMRLEGAGAGNLPAHGFIVNVGWPNWEVITAGCHDMQPMAEGLNVVYCPHSCWRHVNVEFEENGVPGTILELYCYSTGKRWRVETEPKTQDSQLERVARLILPVGNYEVTMLHPDGEPMDVNQMPKPKALEMDTSLGYEVCPGSIALTMANTVRTKNDKRRHLKIKDSF